MTYETKDSGARREFETGSVRDTNEGKPRFDLVPVAALKRWADLMARGAVKYGERNWELGQSMARLEESALRHLYQYLDGDTSEDHLAAVLFNVGALVHHEREIGAGRLPVSLDDRPNGRSIMSAFAADGVRVLQGDGRILGVEPEYVWADARGWYCVADMPKHGAK